MVDRLIELARKLALESDSPEGRELIELVGRVGDPHEESQRHPDQDQRPPDSSRNAMTNNEVERAWKKREKFSHDVNYWPGRGYYVTDSTFSSSNHYHDQEFADEIEAGDAPKMRHESRISFISEDVVLGWATEIAAKRKLDLVAKDHRKEAARRARENHPGTDAADSAKDPHHSNSDDFKTDLSQSTILVSQSQGERFLNGSAVKHSRAVHIEIRGPDGVEIVDVELSMEQFAAALTGHTTIPCTIAAYWSRSEESVRLRERVRPPPSINERLAARIQGRIEEKHEWMREVLADIEKAREGGKAIGKIALGELAKKLATALEHVEGTAEFATEQALEEVASIVETAVIHLGQTHGVSRARLANTPEIAHAFRDLPALPAPTKKGK